MCLLVVTLSICHGDVFAHMMGLCMLLLSGLYNRCESSGTGKLACGSSICRVKSAGFEEVEHWHML